MGLIPWRNKRRELQEGSPMATFQREMDRLFDNFLEPLGAMDWPWRGQGPWLPAIDVSENENEVIVRAELPGIEPNDIDVTITGQQLVVSGEKKETRETNVGDFRESEIRSGTFRRSILLPEGIDADQIEAKHAHGVLTLTIKKSHKTPPKKIEIKPS